MMTVCGISTAYAQDDDETFITGPLSTTTSSTSIAITLTVAPFLTTTSSAGAATPRRRRRRRRRRVEMMLKAEPQAIAQAVTVGSKTDDLAQIFGVSKANHASFSKLLRQHRSALMPLVGGERVDMQTADRFATIIEAAMRADRQLKIDIDRADGLASAG